LSYYHVVLSHLIFFFFQAEDGIRDRNVTGVQTCALPICYHIRSHSRSYSLRYVSYPSRYTSAFAASGRYTRSSMTAKRPQASSRSEERRVGKEGRSRSRTYKGNTMK